MGLDVISNEMNKRFCSDDSFRVLNEIKEACEMSVGVLNNLLSAEKLKKGILQFEKTLVPAFTLILDTISPFFIQVKYFIYISYNI
jgi:hypothetical protein